MRAVSCCKLMWKAEHRLAVEPSASVTMNRDVHLDEAVVEAEAVPDGVLPALLRLPVERKLVLDELVDLAQSAHLERRRLHAATAHIHTYARTNMRTVWSKRTLAAGSRSTDVSLLFCCDAAQLLLLLLLRDRQTTRLERCFTLNAPWMRLA